MAKKCMLQQLSTGNLNYSKPHPLRLRRRLKILAFSLFSRWFLLPAQYRRRGLYLFVLNNLFKKRAQIAKAPNLAKLVSKVAGITKHTARTD
jgi:hypothetical protein